MDIMNTVRYRHTAISSGHPALQLGRALRQMLESTYQATLAGSWGTGEAHLPKPIRDEIFSLSDVDVQVDGDCTSSVANLIRKDVLKMCRRHGVNLTKVSIRSRSEMNELWNIGHSEIFRDNGSVFGNFMIFWALVGALETIVSPANGNALNRTYLTSKFIFKICRNALRVRGCVPRSYQIVIQQFPKLIQNIDLTLPYKIKLGNCDDRHSLEVCNILSNFSHESIINFHMDSASIGLLSKITQDMGTWCHQGIALDVDTYLNLLMYCEATKHLITARNKIIMEVENKVMYDD